MTDRRDVLKQLGGLGLAGMLGSVVPSIQAATQASHAPSADRPNIVLLFADDLGYGDLSSFGHPTIRTPNLDRAGREGVRLTSFYVGAPGCSPSRAALLTGRYPLRTGIWHVLFPQAEKGLADQEVTLAEALKAQDYKTTMVGKWHVGHNKDAFLPTGRGFDHYFGLPYSNDMQPPWVKTDVPIPLIRDGEVIEEPVDQTQLTVRYTEEAIDYIRSTPEDRPFFLYLAYNMPHLPLRVPERFRGTSRAGLYGDTVEMIDWSAGRLLDTLEEVGRSENTIFIFTSDNGPWTNLPDRMLEGGVKPWHVGSPGPLRGAKGTTYEGGLRVPAVIRWPAQIPAGQESAEIATAMDLYATLIKAAGGSLPSHLPIDGNNLLPFLKNEEEHTPTNQFFYYRGRRLEAVRSGPWKLRMSTHARQATEDAPSPELYHLHLDPGERHNRAHDAPKDVSRLKDRMRAKAQEIEGTLLNF